MSLPSTTKELDAVNDILNSIGQASVTSIDQTNPDVSLAYRTLLSISREVQSEGWSFNQEYDVQFSVDSATKKIAVPPDIINIDATKEYYQYDTIVRNDFLCKLALRNMLVKRRDSTKWYLSFARLCSRSKTNPEGSSSCHAERVGNQSARMCARLARAADRAGVFFIFFTTCCKTT